MILTFPKESRIRKKSEYRQFLSRPFFKGRYVLIYYFNNHRRPKLGITCSKKFAANACVRNRFKRIAKEAFRLTECPYPLSLHLLPLQKAVKATMTDIQQDLISFYSSYFKDNS